MISLIWHKLSNSYLVSLLTSSRPGGAYMHQSWWHHQMETFSALLAICARNSPVPGEFPAQRPVTRSFDGFFALRLNKRLSKQSWGWWFETLSRPLWCNCNGKRGHHWFRYWFVARSAPSHYLNQCCYIISCHHTARNKFQRKLNKITTILIKNDQKMSFCLVLNMLDMTDLIEWYNSGWRIDKNIHLIITSWDYLFSWNVPRSTKFALQTRNRLGMDLLGFNQFHRCC